MKHADAPYLVFNLASRTSRVLTPLSTYYLILFLFQCRLKLFVGVEDTEVIRALLVILPMDRGSSPQTGVSIDFSPAVQTYNNDNHSFLVQRKYNIPRNLQNATANIPNNPLPKIPRRQNSLHNTQPPETIQRHRLPTSTRPPLRNQTSQRRPISPLHNPQRLGPRLLRRLRPLHLRADRNPRANPRVPRHFHRLRPINRLHTDERKHRLLH